MPFEYEGRNLVARFCASIFGAGRRFELVRTRANGQPALGAYLRAPTGICHGGRPLRPHSHRRTDLRHDPLRKQCAPMVRATAIAPEPITSFGFCGLNRKLPESQLLARLSLWFYFRIAR